MNKAELSSLPAHTKLMPLRYKAELSSLPAHTKLMPLRYQHCKGPVDHLSSYLGFTTA